MKQLMDYRTNGSRRSHSFLLENEVRMMLVGTEAPAALVQRTKLAPKQKKIKKVQINKWTNGVIANMRVENFAVSLKVLIATPAMPFQSHQVCDGSAAANDLISLSCCPQQIPGPGNSSPSGESLSQKSSLAHFFRPLNHKTNQVR